MVQIVGWGHTKFGKLADFDLEALIISAGREALDHAGVAPGDVDGIWLGHFNGGMVGDGFPASLALGIHDDLRFTPATRLENACASGAAAIFAARDAIESGRTKIALVIGAEKMTHLPTSEVARGLGHAAYQAEETGMSFPQVFAGFARAYFDKYGDQSDALAQIAVKNHANAMRNPLAQLHKELSYEFCAEVSDKNPMVADPLKVTDCSLVSDGAAALVMVSDDVARSMPRAVRFAASQQVNDFLPMSRRDLTAFEGPKRAILAALTEAGMGLANLHLAEVHDCFTIAELMIYEAMGLAEPGQGAQALQDGIVQRGGALPVNLSGGLKAKGHPVGATGVSMHVLMARQVTGAAAGMQVAGAERGLVFNMGGSGVASYASILEGVR
ncbi:acetyl-CoA acetyltransferase [Aliiroseovarius crassostreae]|uniref:acetyl-CoA acetyltransferase n=1 Tax=Aliiroseovarius crassostreae TaxID=154981 RepID=UPI0022091990|nr:acetyl-CoA acetyltransferase [Aliiroseovarius crassostreae]UWP89885.1 acetyl-CoA acetyltransferase [Aliiroseovarius crassostreae]